MNKLFFTLLLLCTLSVSCNATPIEPISDPLMNESSDTINSSTQESIEPSTNQLNSETSDTQPNLTPTSESISSDLTTSLTTPPPMVESSATPRFVTAEAVTNNKYELNYDPSWSSILSTNQTADPKLATTIITAAATQFDTTNEKITLHRFNAVTWNSSALGCPDPRARYMQVITPGYQIIVSYNKNYYAYHADKKGRFVLCDPRFMQPIDQSTTPADQ